MRANCEGEKNESEYGSQCIDNRKQKEPEEKKLFEIEGRKGLYMESETISDKYDARPKGIETLTLSQFATSYTKCNIIPKDLCFNEKNVSEKTGYIIDHITEEPLPSFIKLSTNAIYRLRKYSTVLRIHSSSKKEGEEAYFAEMQLFTPWRSPQLEVWTKPEECIKEYQKRLETISIVKRKTFPFSMNEIIEEMNAQERLNQVSDEVKKQIRWARCSR